MNDKLTHRIVVDSGQWAKGKTEADAMAMFRKLHSGRRLQHKQVWAVTPNMRIDDHGRFVAPRDEYAAPVKLN